MEAANAAELLQWYADMGVDEAIGDAPVDRTKTLPTAIDIKSIAVPEKAALLAMPVPGSSQPPVQPLAASRSSAAVTSAPAAVAGAMEAIKDAEARAAAAKTLDDLRAALEAFDGLTLKRTATNMVFADGVPTARVMVIGDAPGADEDRAGLPFLGENGAMLDKMLAAIGLKRDANVYLTTIINWRPPGNRAAEETEVSMSLPFIKKHIALVNPAVIMFVGGAPVKMLLNNKEPIMRLRGKWLEYDGGDAKIPALAMLHPEYLSRNPAQKKVAWEDLQMLQGKLKELGVL